MSYTINRERSSGLKEHTQMLLCVFSATKPLPESNLKWCNAFSFKPPVASLICWLVMSYELWVYIYIYIYIYKAGPSLYRMGARVSLKVIANINFPFEVMFKLTGAGAGSWCSAWSADPLREPTAVIFQIAKGILIKPCKTKPQWHTCIDASTHWDMCTHAWIHSYEEKEREKEKDRTGRSTQWLPSLFFNGLIHDASQLMIIRCGEFIA